jgi:hypothetical protein
LPSRPGSEDELEDGGGTEPPGDGDGDGDLQDAGGVLDAGGPPPWLIDGRDARLACPLTASVEEALSRSCPAVMDVAPCDQPDAPCAHYDATSVPGSLLICQTRCRHDLGPPFWATTCANECQRECPAPTPGALVVELDATECMSLPMQECFADGLTLQDQLDRELQALLHRATSSGELVNQFVVVHFEHGCATRALLPDEHSLPIIEPILREELSGLRLRCASMLSCGTISGPMTLP